MDEQNCRLCSVPTVVESQANRIVVVVTAVHYRIHVALLLISQHGNLRSFQTGVGRFNYNT